MAHVPAARIVTVSPPTLQTALVTVENVTAVPDPPPLATTSNAGSVATLSASAANEIAWLALRIVTIWVARDAGAYRLSPA